MSTWLTKELALDLLAITIDGLNKISDRINKDQPAMTMTEAPDPATAHPSDLPPTAPEMQMGGGGPAIPEPTAEPPVEAGALLVEAQDHLRRLAQAEGIDWIRDTLFPHFQVESLTDVPAGRLPELIGMVEAKTEQAAA